MTRTSFCLTTWRTRWILAAPFILAALWYWEFTLIFLLSAVQAAAAAFGPAILFVVGILLAMFWQAVKTRGRARWKHAEMGPWLPDCY